MTGKIIKGIAGFYYVYIDINTKADTPDAGVSALHSDTPVKGVFECKAKGAFRKDKLKPLVGDNVEIKVLDSEKRIGNIESILERKNSLIRPAVANIDQALVIFAAAKPTPNLNLLDRFLISMEKQGIDTIICFNKTDIADEDYVEQLERIYTKSGYKVMFTSTINGEGIDKLKELLKGKTTVLAGPSGVGKSSLTNTLIPQANMTTGNISTKIERGKHTTRHSEIFIMDEDGFLFDTPGFSSLDVKTIDKDDIKYYFREFEPYNDRCRFAGCVHINEPDCAVKQALSEGIICQERYDNYKLFYEESSQQRKY